MSQKHLLLIGCGDLPTRLVRKLDLGIWQVDGLRRSNIEIPGVQISTGDANNIEDIKTLIAKKPDQIIITLTPDSRGTETYINTYLKPAKNVVQIAQELAPSAHLIFVSSTSVFAQNKGEIVDECSDTSPTRETSQILLAAEKEIEASSNPSTIVRFSGIYGPGRTRLIEKVSSENYTKRDEASWTNRIHSEDCAALLAHLINHKEIAVNGAGIMIGTDHQSVINLDVERWLASQLKIAYPAKEADDIQAKGKRCSNQKLLDSGFTFQYANYQKGYSALLN